MEIDIRHDDDELIDKVIFAGLCEGDAPYSIVSSLEFEEFRWPNHIFISGNTASDDRLCIRHEDIPNLIKALQKAEDLWCK